VGVRAFAIGAPPFVHVQATAAATWTIAHDFGGKPAVKVIVGGREVHASVEYADDATVVVKFRLPQSGEARLL
jgi:hypothetical protein